MFIIVISRGCIEILLINNVLFVSCKCFLFKVYFILYQPPLLPFQYYLNIFSHPFFSTCLSLDLRWVSCRQHIVEACVFIYATLLCLSVGQFKPFTSKVITDKQGLPPAILFVIVLLFLSFSITTFFCI